MLRKILLFIAIAGFSAGAVLLYGVFSEAFLKANANVQASIIAGFVAVLAAVYSHTTANMREIKARQYINKKEACEAFLNFLNDVAVSGPQKKPVSEAQMLKNLFEFKKQLLSWGDKELIRAYDKYERSAGTTGTKDIFMNIDDLMRAIRAELGHNDAGLQRGALVGIFLKAEDRDKILRPISTAVRAFFHIDKK